MTTLTVLYYKRSSKVHKTGKEDGQLIISSNGKVTLLDASSVTDNEASDDDNENEQRASKKAQWNAIRKSVMSSKKSSGTNRMIYSGVNKEIANRAASNEICEDDVLIVGAWECQVVDIIDDNSKGDTSCIRSGNDAVKRPMRAAMVSNQIIKRASLVPLRKNPTTSVTGLKRPLVSTIPAVQRQIGFKVAKVTCTSSVAAGKMKKDKNGEWYLDQSDSSEEDEEDVNTKPGTVIPNSLVRKGPLKTLKSTFHNKFKRDGDFGKTTAARSISTTKSTNKITNEFPGAIGTIHVPAQILKVLRPHQRDGIAFLWNCVTGAQEGIKRVYHNVNSGDDSDDDIGGCREVPKGAVLADEMGLGKTLMTISTIYALYRQTRTNRFIVVCPSSLVTNWAKEFDKWIGKASNPKRVVVRSGSEEGIRSLKSFVLSQNSEVLILSYELFRMHVGIISKANRIGLLVVDEGHRLKNTNGSQTLSALNSLSVEARVLITGTPIQNNLGEFYNVANFALPGILGELNTFRRYYERPICVANRKNATKEEKERGRVQSIVLKEINKTFLLRRLQKDVLKSLLPPRMEFLLFCRPSVKQCELYQDISDRTIGSIRQRDENPLTLLTELRKLCTHPKLLEKDASLLDDDVALSGKLVVLDGLIDSIRENHPTDKVVIISNFTSALSVIESSILRKKKLPFFRLDGTVELLARQPMVDSFNNGSVNHSFAFLLSSKAGGCGLNLIGANRIIMVDADWNPATDHQAMARVYRQGQKKPCFIYRLFTTGTLEEVIFQRQTQKGLVQLTDDGCKSTSNFSPEELRDCFTLKQGSNCDTKDKLGKQWGDYLGVSSLRNQGCMDQPLLAVSHDLADTLSFVRVVDDDFDEQHDKLSDEACINDFPNSASNRAKLDVSCENAEQLSCLEDEDFDG